MQSLAAFIQPRQGQRVYCAPDCTSNDPYGQCVALANAWACVNGWPTPRGYTAATLAFPSPWFRVPLSEARAGDLPVWSAALPGSNGDGHIDVYVGPLPGGFQGFDQNWSILGCALVNHGAGDLPYLQAVWRYPDSPAPGPLPGSVLGPIPPEVDEMIICTTPNQQGIWLLYGRTFDHLDGAEAAAYRELGLTEKAIDEAAFTTFCTFPGRRLPGDPQPQP